MKNTLQSTRRKHHTVYHLFLSVINSKYPAKKKDIKEKDHNLKILMMMNHNTEPLWI